jgi:predicted ATPase
MTETTASGVVAAVVWSQDEHGLTPTTWEKLDVVDHYRRFLAGPMQYLRHLLPD